MKQGERKFCAVVLVAATQPVLAGGGGVAALGIDRGGRAIPILDRCAATGKHDEADGGEEGGELGSPVS